jgi:hypothetical protein
MLVPMAMPGSAKQDKSLSDFLTKTCTAFLPRSLRMFRRHPVCIPTLIKCNNTSHQGFTLNLSWTGAFIVDISSERFAGNPNITVSFPTYGLSLEASIRWFRTWGEHFAPGIGLSFSSLDNSVTQAFSTLLKSSKEFDRDRLTAL